MISVGFFSLRAEKPMTLEECLQRAVKANRVLQSSVYEVDIAEANLEAARADRSPALVASGDLQDNQRRNTVEQELSQLNSIFDERNQRYSAALEAPIPLGGEARLGLRASELTNNLTRGENRKPFEPEYVTFAGISLTQPLLKDAGRVGARSQIEVARVLAERSGQALRRQKMSTVALTESAFWDVVLAQREVSERRKSVAISEKLVADNRERVELGKMSDLEIFQAEAGVALRRTRLYQAEQKLLNFQNRLSSILARKANRPVEVEDREPAIEPQLPPLDQALSDALSLHPDYVHQKLVVEEEGVRLLYAKNQSYPELNLLASYGFNGLGDSYGNSVDDLSDSDFDSWSVGVTLRIPWGGGGAAKRFRAAEIRKMQALNDLKGIEIEVFNSIRTAHNKAASSREVIKDFRTVVDYNLKVLKSEQDRLGQGKSNSRRVLQVEEDLTEARIAALEAAVDHRKALIEMRLTDGTLLRHHGMEAGKPLPRMEVAP